jgi:L-alanine-DL-glutamate epimerase-like enolase superfamily enzyme
VVKIQKAGGPEGLARALDVARERALTVGLTGKVAESSLAGAALLHAAAAHGEAAWGASLTLTSLALDPVVEPVHQLDGWWHLPPGPGYGVEVDRSELLAHRRPDRGQ